MKHKNIIWILVDSIRNYRTEYDERGKLEVMEKYGKNFILGDLETKLAEEFMTYQLTEKERQGLAKSQLSECLN